MKDSAQTLHVHNKAGNKIRWVLSEDREKATVVIDNRPVASYSFLAEDFSK